MDEIQKVLVKAGRKDLAQKYYEKVAKSKWVITEHEFPDDDVPKTTYTFFKEDEDEGYFVDIVAASSRFGQSDVHIDGSGDCDKSQYHGGNKIELSEVPDDVIDALPDSIKNELK